MTGFEHIVKRRLNLLWRANAALLQIDADDFNTNLVAVKNSLHQRADARGNLIALFSQSRIHFHFADYFANSGFSGLHDGVGRVFAFKQIGPGIAQTVLHRKLDFNDVFVFGQHG